MHQHGRNRKTVEVDKIITCSKEEDTTSKKEDDLYTDK
jgi:hypothetical protein